MQLFLAYSSVYGLASFAVTEKVVKTGMDRPWADVKSPDNQL